ncbi:MAG: IPT/TIG domain-containing protein [Bryobacteraceae bacterium]
MPFLTVPFATEMLCIRLEQSPFLNLLSRSRVQETLTEMRRKSDEPLTPALAREVCQRNNGQAMLHSTGAVRLIGMTGVHWVPNPEASGLSTNSSTLYFASPANELYTLDTSNGQATLVGSYGGTAIAALLAEGGTLYGAYSTIATINTATGAPTYSAAAQIAVEGLAPYPLPIPATPEPAAVISAGEFGGASTVAPGTWVEIYGSNLASTTRQWTTADFNGINAPTSIDGVQVTIGGQEAFVDYVSPGQVNAQLPSNIGQGSFQLTVTSAGVTSAPVNVTVNATRPGLLASPSFDIGGNQYVVAQAADGTYILPAGSIAGINSRPARPNETIVIYGIGFGTVTPATPAGQIVSGSTQLTAPLQVWFGSSPAQLSYAGLAPGYVGLYQFNIVVPAVADSDLVPLTFSLGGVAGTQTLYTAVHQ